MFVFDSAFCTPYCDKVLARYRVKVALHHTYIVVLHHTYIVVLATYLLELCTCGNNVGKSTLACASIMDTRVLIHINVQFAGGIGVL